MEGKKMTIRKTKKQIEADHPIVKPEDCPGLIIDWVVKRDEEREIARDAREAKRDKDMIELIEVTIDKLFEKHFRKYVTMIFNNRLFIVLTLILVIGAWSVILYQIYK